MWNINNKIRSPDATVWFPASGYRSYGNGSLFYAGTDGYYWSAIRRNLDCGCKLNFTQGYVVPQDGNFGRACGFSVRPVAEPKTRVTPKLPGSTEEDWSNNEDLDAGDIDI